MVAPFVIPAITGGLSMIGRAVQGGPPQYQSDPELRKRMQGQQQRYEQMVKGRGPSLGCATANSGSSSSTKCRRSDGWPDWPSGCDASGAGAAGCNVWA